MALLKSIGIAFALAAGVAAQSDGEKVWAAVAFINEAERTPLMGPLNTVLTPEGAQQMLRLGTAFRARYIRNGVNDTEYRDVEKAYIENINTLVIDNTELEIVSQTYEWVSGGAVAFMQGLYPAELNAWDSSSGFSSIAMDYRQGTERTEYPLDGYQYPNVRTWGISDPQSVALQGNIRCSNWEGIITGDLIADPTMVKLHEDTLDFYQELFSTAPLIGTFSLRDANFWNAYVIYDYVNYMYTHNETVFENLKNPNTTINRLADYAITLERAKYSIRDDSGHDTAVNTLYTIGGRTLAERLALQMTSNVEWNSSRDRLSLFFGSFEPMISFLSLAGIYTPQSMALGPFASLPKPGATIVFELYGDDPDNSNRRPGASDLKVRFYYRASADADDVFQPLPLFDSDAAGKNLTYASFMQNMKDLGKTASEWCGICGRTQAPWCTNSVYVDGGSGGSYRYSMDPWIAGIIGAVIMLGIIILFLAALFVVGKFRLRREPGLKGSTDDNTPVTPAAGGFKGPEKKDGDADVTVTRTGAHHERVGSWELRDAPPVMGGLGIVSRDTPRGRPSLEDDEINLMGQTPVKAREEV